MHEKIKNLSEKRINFFLENDYPFYKGNQTYINGLMDELSEIQNEIKDNNSVYLEDELGDLFWDYMCLLHSLKNEGKITSVEKVFERAYNKFSRRVGIDGTNNGGWEEVKKIQKEELKKEHNNLYLL